MPTFVCVHVCCWDRISLLYHSMGYATENHDRQIRVYKSQVIMRYHIIKEYFEKKTKAATPPMGFFFFFKSKFVRGFSFISSSDVGKIP